jgi:predicted RNase H-like HicB family nuclease
MHPFGEMVFRDGKSHQGVILLRLEDERPSNKIRILERLLGQYSDPNLLVILSLQLKLQYVSSTSEMAGNNMAGREFYLVIEKDEDGFYVGEVPQLRGCYSQGRTLDELIENMKEVIQLCLEDEKGKLQ